MIAETAQLVADMQLKDGFTAPATRMQRTLRGLNLDTAKLKQGFQKVGDGLRLGFKRSALIGAGAIGLLAAGIKGGINDLAELEDAQHQTEAVLESTGRAAGVTADEVRKLAEQYEDLTTIDDKVIQGGENVLLTFTNIRRKAFEPTIAAALDMATALKMDTTSAFRTLGKALNDPIAGLARLTRIGVTFTEAEKEKVAQLVKTGQTLKAQNFILGRVNRMFGGSASAAAQGYRGQMRRLDDALEDVRKSLAGPLLRPLTNVARKMAEFAKSKDIQKGLRSIGEAVAELFKPKVSVNAEGGVTVMASAFDKGFAALKEGFGFLKNLPWDTIQQGAQGILRVASASLSLFKSLPEPVQAALVTMLAANKLTGGLVASGLKDIATFVLRSLTTINAANVTVVGANVTGPGVPGAPGAPTGGGPSLIQQLSNLVVRAGAGGGALTVARNFVAPIEARLHELGAYIQQNNDLTSKQQGQLFQLVTSGASVEDAVRQVRGAVFTAGHRTTGSFDSGLRELKVPVVARLDQIKQGTQTGNAKTGQVLTATQRMVAGEAMSHTWLGRVADATRGVTSAIQRKDLSVKVNVAVPVSVREIATGVARVTNQRRVVIS